MIYLDYAATTPMLPQAIEAYTQAATTVYGNAASLHDVGGLANMYVERVRRQIAAALQVVADGVYFTGSGTEGNWLALLSLALAQPKRHIITSAAEHTSIHAAVNYLEQHGFTVTRLQLTAQGIIDMTQLEQAITDDTALISIQYVNSEIGSIQPVAEIAALAKQQAILYHVDCVQAFCKVALRCEVDALTVSAHKIGGPKGCGAVYINPRCRPVPIFPGMTHERGLRGGTLDVAAIIAFGAALEHFSYDLQQQWQLRRQLTQQLATTYGQIIEAPADKQLPNIIGLCINGMEGQHVMLACNERGIAISTGSACDINSASGTKAILAMGKSFDEARQFCRISIGSTTNSRHIEALSEILNSLIHERHHVQ